jgi:hypothetical protein
MRHLVMERDLLLDEDTVDHLQGCQRCRSGLVSDIDGIGLWARIQGDLIATPTVQVAASKSPWVFAVLAAAVVIATIVVGGRFLQRGSSVAVVTTQPSATSLRPAPEFPEVPPPSTPIVPEPSSDRPNFDMTFEVVNEAGVPVSTGRLVWAALNFYKVLKIDDSPDGPSFGYSFYRNRDETGLNDPHDQFVRTGDSGDLSYPPDPAIPWKVLTRVLTTEQMWEEITGGDTAPQQSQPTHPLAGNAFAGAGFRLELSPEGIPVKIERPGFGVFQATSLEVRTISAVEVGGNIELPFRYALYLSAESSDYQREILQDGIVSSTEYRQAVEAAAACSNDQPETTTSCSAEFLDNVRAAWDADSFALSENDFVILHSLVEGDLESVEMYQTEPGEERVLAEGPGWTISIQERGRGLCTKTSTAAGPSGAGSHSQGCFTKSKMRVPGRMHIDLGFTSLQGVGSQGQMLGIVEEDAREVVISFSTGESVTLQVGDTAEFGFRGFGFLFETADLGTPIGVEAYDSEGNLLLSYQVPELQIPG